MSSRKLGKLGRGTEIVALEQGVDDSVRRIKCAYGWVSFATAGGEVILAPASEDGDGDEDEDDSSDGDSAGEAETETESASRGGTAADAALRGSKEAVAACQREAAAARAELAATEAGLAEAEARVEQAAAEAARDVGVRYKVLQKTVVRVRLREYSRRMLCAVKRMCCTQCRCVQQKIKIHAVNGKSPRRACI